MTIGPFKQPEDSTVTANGVSQVALPENGKRLSASLTNLGTVPVYVGFGAVGVLGQGHVIPGPGIMELDLRSDEDTWMGDVINVITDGTPCILSISEVTK